MKRFILIADESNYNRTTLVNEKELKELLINEIEEYTYENTDEREIIIDNFKLMKKLAIGNYTTDDLMEQIGYYGYGVCDLYRLQEDLSTYQAYKHGVGCPCIPHDSIEDTLELIEKDMNRG